MSFTTDYGVFLGNIVYKGFNHFTTEAMPTQEKTLQKIMRKNADCELGKKYHFEDIHSLREYQDKVPISTFEDYLPMIGRMLEGDNGKIITSQKIHRYCSSSGSVGIPKLQPKTARDLWNMQCMGFAATPACANNWLKKNTNLKKLPTAMGPLVLSLNGVKMKNGFMANGAAQIPFYYIKPILKHITTTPMDILFPEDEEHTDTAYFQLRFALVNTEVTYLGSLVITLLTNMFEYLEDNWQMICDDIEKGTIDPRVRATDNLRKNYGHMKPNPARAAELRKIFEGGFDGPVPVGRQIWPKLVWGYGMIGSTLAVYVEKLRRYVGDIPLHNMGYAASEGYMAMPVELNANDSVLLPRSLVYEFLPEDAPEGMRPLLLDEVEVGKNYEIIITNFSGLYRYRIMDIVKITGKHNNTPKIEFLYRSNMGLNLANEKTTTQMLDWVAEKMQQKFDLNFRGYSFYSETNVGMPHYVMVAEPDKALTPELRKELSLAVDEFFRECNEKYEKYRRWNMIGDSVFFELEEGAYAAYRELLLSQGRVLNQIKPVIVLNTPERKDFFYGKITAESAAENAAE